jgi:hypothetical protein
LEYLSIDEYDTAERTARAVASYPAIRAFSPVAFTQVNFPTRVNSERELIRYADIMYELLPRSEWLEKQRYTEQEKQAILQLVDQIRALTGDLFGRSVQPLMCLFPPIPIVRAIEAIAVSRGRRLQIFEVGPGSGYVGAYLLNAGHRYAAMDNCQALYLWQNRLLLSIAPDCSEWVSDRDRRTDGAFAARAEHVPWWRFATFHESGPPKADIVVCDAAMGEMDTFALYYLLRISREILKGSDCGAFIFQNLGEERVNGRSQVEGLLTQLGFVGRKIGGVSLFSLHGPLHDVFAAALDEIPPIGPTASGMFAPREFLSIRPSELLESYRFFSFIGLGT